MFHVHVTVSQKVLPRYDNFNKSVVFDNVCVESNNAANVFTPCLISFCDTPYLITRPHSVFYQIFVSPRSASAQHWSPVFVESLVGHICYYNTLLEYFLIIVGKQ